MTTAGTASGRGPVLAQAKRKCLRLCLHERAQTLGHPEPLERCTADPLGTANGYRGRKPLDATTASDSPLTSWNTAPSPSAVDFPALELFVLRSFPDIANFVWFSECVKQGDEVARATARLLL